MRSLLLLITFSISSTLCANTLLKEVKKTNSRTSYFDYNNDTKSDLIEYRENEILVKKERDIDYDGVFDETTEYLYHNDEKKPFEIITQKNRITKLYRNLKLKKIIKVVEIDTDGNGIYEHKAIDQYPIDQKNKECPKSVHQNYFASIFNLNTSISNAISKMTGNATTSAFGHIIDSACSSNYPELNFTKVVTESISHGLSCIEFLSRKNIAEKPIGPNGALENLINLNRLMKVTPVTIVCSEMDYDWDGVLGHASTASSDVIKSLNIKHPFISLAPRNSVKSGTLKADELIALKRTIFHEQLHNLGFIHSGDIEYPYTCGECCFPDVKAKDYKANARAAACKICRGQYKGIATKEYLVDLLDWSEKDYDSEKAEPIIQSYLKQNPKSRWGISILANSNAGYFSAVGVELAKLVKERVTNLTLEDQKHINEALTYANAENVKNIAGEAKIVADGFYQFYYLNNAKKTIDFMHGQKDILKKIRSNAKNQKIPIEQRYANKKIDQDTKTILTDLYMINYPDTNNPIALKALDLLSELSLVD